MGRPRFEALGVSLLPFLDSSYLLLAHLQDAAQQIQISICQHVNHLWKTRYQASHLPYRASACARRAEGRMSELDAWGRGDCAEHGRFGGIPQDGRERTGSNG